MKLFKTSILAAFGLALALGGAASAAPLDHHPRRAEVVDRIHNQNVRINHERREGELTGRQAHRMHMKEHAMLHREQRDAHMHGGHIAKGEQHALNHRLNHMSKRIGG